MCDQKISVVNPERKACQTLWESPDIAAELRRLTLPCPRPRVLGEEHSSIDHNEGEEISKS